MNVTVASSAPTLQPSARSALGCAASTMPSVSRSSSGRYGATRTIVRVAPYLPDEERDTLGIVDAAQPSADLALGWSVGALLATVTFIDRVSGARAPYSAVGAIAPHGNGYV